MSIHRRSLSPLLGSSLAFSLTLATGLGAPLPAMAAAASVGIVELSPTPPNITQAVPPNILVTFDDSGSMDSDFMGDNRPFDNGSWGGPWRCAGVIDPNDDDKDSLRSYAMNGVYYNPGVTYDPPMKADGTTMPNADSSLEDVWNDGIQENRPRNSSDNEGSTDFTGTTKKNTWYCGQGTSRPLGNGGGPYYWQLKSNVNIGTVANPNTNALYNASNWEVVAVPKADYQNWANWWAYYRTRNLMTQTSVSRVFGKLGSETDTGGFGSSFRVAWQNLNDGNFQLPSSAIITSLVDAAGCKSSSIDPKDTQRAGGVKKSPDCYRSAFFNWIFQIGSPYTTPNRASTIRAGKFFQRGEGNTGGSGNLTDPYWQPPKVGNGDGLELTCRQNYHMLVTDGYWNEGNPGVPGDMVDVQGTPTLGDGTTTFTHNPVNKVFWNVPSSRTGNCRDGGDTDCYPSLADIAFSYWAQDLRPDLDNKVPTYMPDNSFGITTSGGTDALKDVEKYWNPANDPATWQHVVQYMVTLGVSGFLTQSKDELENLRKGTTAWPQPARNNPASIDDTWHAAINSRGGYFSASNPKTLEAQLSNILLNISDRGVPATASAINTSVLVPGALAYQAGYKAGEWIGVFKAVTANADGTVVDTGGWDAQDILTNKTTPAKRNILTAKEKADGSFDTGIAFDTFTNLDNLTAAAGSSYQSAQDLLANTPPGIVGVSQDTGQARLDYIRGVRTLEADTFRARTGLLGAIINSQALYVGAPASGYRNSWPSGSPEATAIAADNPSCASSTPTTCHTYESFISNYRDRLPVVYIGANDGMLHAFNAKQTVSGVPPVTAPDADAGKEVFAYVPRSAYENLGNLTRRDGFKFAPTVDATPVTRDVFFGDAWHTILVGGLRLGGRGVYALDITDPTEVTEANAGSKVLWEFNSDTKAVSGKGDPANLGYTFGQPNIGRLHNGKWVVLVPGGYFPDCSKPDKPANCQTIAASSNKFSSLFVLDAETGELIKELTTPTNITGVTSYGLSSPVLGDYNNDQIDDLAFAGDLNGNLWRFDLTDADPNNWQSHITLAFKPAVPGDQPITSMPRLFPDPATNRFIVVFGTGKYLGAEDNTSDSAEVQSIYGIRDVFDSSNVLKTFTRADLQEQKLSEGASTNGTSTVRGLTDNTLTAAQGGWFIDLELTTSPGERVVVTPGALFDTNRVLIATLIPGTQDLCDATITGAEMIFNAATGGSAGGLSGPPGPSGWGADGISVVGGIVNNPPTGGSLPIATTIGGGTLLVPGLELKGGGTLGIDDAIWRRRSWRELNNDQ